MKFQKQFSVSQVVSYVLTDPDHRPLVRYDPSLLDPDPVFTSPERDRLMNELRLPEHHVYTAGDVQKLLINLSWASSHLEGNTYSHLDTQALIEYGHVADGKTADETRMILNHKKAISHILAQPEISTGNIRAIHRLLMTTDDPHCTADFLEDFKCGMVRRYTPHGLHITGSRYIPPQAESKGPEFIVSEFDRLVQNATTLESPVDQSFFLLTRIPYLQVFYDGNKRTGRLSANLPLLNANLCPAPFLNFSRNVYLKGLLGLYELSDERLLKTAYVKAAVTASLDYVEKSPEERMAALQNRSGYISAKCRDILGDQYQDPDDLLDTMMGIKGPLPAPANDR